MPDITLVLPYAADGRYATEDVISRGLSRLARAIPGTRAQNGSHYGMHWNDTIFSMHPFCWCDRDDCPWCCGCQCPPTAFRYTIDGQPVSFEQYVDHRKTVLNAHPELLAYADTDPRLQAFEQHYTDDHDPQCAFCRGTGFPEFGVEPEHPAPNFWYKPANVKIWWYKYIGRSMEIQSAITPKTFETIIAACLQSVRASRSRKFFPPCSFS